MILDEIATGFWRTGTALGGRPLRRERPDIVCVGKALTGGYLTWPPSCAPPTWRERVSASRRPAR